MMIKAQPITCLILILLLLLLLLPLVLINHHLLAAAQVTTTDHFTNNETDYHSLLAIKSHITSDPFDILGSWNDSRPFCTWSGVVCGKKHHRVTLLNLTSLALTGSLSPHIGNLTFLRVFSLYDNAFHGNLPPEITYLPRLKLLNLGRNKFQGELPNELGNLLKLTQIELSNNLFTGKIPPSLGNLSALIHLNISENFIGGTIPIELTRLSNLTVLQLSVNNLNGLVPDGVYNMTSLVLLSLTSNNLHGQLPPDMFLTLPNLQKLYLGNNSFSGPLPISITNASKLHTIDLFSCNFSGSIPKNLGGRLKDLEVLNFGGNTLGTEKGDDLRFIASLVNCTKLRLFWVPKNQLKGVIPNSVANLSTTLTSFRLEQNFISGTIPEGIGNLLNLELLGLSFNFQLEGEIPDSIAKLSNLKQLYIIQTNIGGRIPPSIGNLTSLTHLYLAANLLEGSIPPSLGKCTNLIVLALGGNSLVGEVPQQLFALPSLALGLFLSGNNLSGPLLSQVGQLENVGDLDLADNGMEGEIPTTLGDCQMLEYITFQGNHFNGSIPSSLKNLRGLRALDLSRNNLSGPIPSFLAQLPMMESLNLSFNMFEGEVPNGGIFSNLSAVSLVGNHKLCGGPPSLQLQPCIRKRRTTQLNVLHVVAISSAAAIFIIILLCVVGIACRSRKPRQQTSSCTFSSTDEHPRLSYADLFQATDGFSSCNILGEGSFGVVYKGVLRNRIIAVKVIKVEEEGASKSFMTECEALRNIRHRNLVKTITSCSNTEDFHGNDFKALVFEFMPYGSVEKWLHPSSSFTDTTTPRLSLLQRLSIAIDVAAALNYLHHFCHSPIVHCDLKSSNVLLDSDMTAHLSDFGLAKSLVETSSIRMLRGTLGYIPPEYGLGGGVSTQGDVYSFGILLLEIFTGKRPTAAMFVDGFGLREFVVRAVPEGLSQVVDPILLNWRGRRRTKSKKI